MARKEKPLAFEIATRLTKLEKEQLEQVELPDVDAWVDDRIARKKAAHYNKPSKQLPKNLRPQCGAKTRAGGKCKAPPVWDKANNRPVNGRCRMHGGLSTGPKTEEGKRRSLAGLEYGRGRSKWKKPEK